MHVHVSVPFFHSTKAPKLINFAVPSLNTFFHRPTDFTNTLISITRRVFHLFCKHLCPLRITTTLTKEKLVILREWEKKGKGKEERKKII